MSFHFLLVLLLLSASGFVLVPYLRSSRAHIPGSVPQTESNVDIYAARLKELEQELKAERISASEFEQLKDELGLGLLIDAGQIPSQDSQVPPLERRTHVLLSVSSVLIIIVGSWLLYTNIGSWPEVEIQEAAAVLEQDNVAPEKLQALIELLNNRLLELPQDTNSWYILGHTHMKQGSFRQSVNAFDRLRLLTGADINIETSLAQARYLADEGKISDVNRQAMQNILKRAPHQPLILEILAIEAFQNQDAAGAISYLEQGLAGGLRGDRAESFRLGIKRAQEMKVEMGARITATASINTTEERRKASGRIVIQLSMDPAIQAAPETAIFVFAREQGGMPMPLAVKRLSVGDLPAEIVFSDADAMVDSRLLSQFGKVELVARLSYSGQPGLQPGDVESSMANVVVTQLKAPIVLRLEP